RAGAAAGGLAAARGPRPRGPDGERLRGLDRRGRAPGRDGGVAVPPRKLAFHDLPQSADGRAGRRPSDGAVIRAPQHLGTSRRAGARFGPDAIRRAPYLSGEAYHIAYETEVFERITVVDAGDADVPVGSTEGGLACIRDHARRVAAGTR